MNLGLQDHAVVIIAEPDGYAPFVNTSFAGFIGSVTDMNLNGVAFGELGGGGYGQWDGAPVSEQPYTYLNIAELMAHEPPTP